MSAIQYSVYIRWSDEDKCYIAWLPEFDNYTHGETYEEAAKNAREVLELLVDGVKDLPRPHKFGGGHTITPPSHESEPLDPDWLEKETKKLDASKVSTTGARVAG